MGLSSLLPSRLAVISAVGCLIFVPLAVFTAYGWGLSNRDRIREEQRADGLYDQIHAAGVGYKDRLTMSQANLAGAQAALATQNKAVDDLKAASDAAAVRAQAAVDAAQARATVAQQRAQQLLLEQPRPGETRCEAADRLILEQVR